MKQKGAFTLIEVLLVVVLLGVVAGLAIPNFSNSYKSLVLQNTAGDLAHLMRYAQSRSVMRRAKVDLVFGSAFDEYWLEESLEANDTTGESGHQQISGRWGRKKAVPEQCQMRGEQQRVIFYPDGKMDAVEISVCRQKREEEQGDCVIVSTQWQQGQVVVLQKISEGF
ncbi:GspH/FimT family protein [Candidatus Omnitrophota bacterium]